MIISDIFKRNRKRNAKLIFVSFFINTTEQEDRATIPFISYIIVLAPFYAQNINTTDKVKRQINNKVSSFHINFSLALNCTMNKLQQFLNIILN